MGGLTGVSTGLTGTFVVPGTFYLQRMLSNRQCTRAGNGVVRKLNHCGVATISLGVSLGGRGAVLK